MNICSLVIVNKRLAAVTGYTVHEATDKQTAYSVLFDDGVEQEVLPQDVLPVTVQFTNVNQSIESLQLLKAAWHKNCAETIANAGNRDDY